MKHLPAYLFYGAENRARKTLPFLNRQWHTGRYPYCGRRGFSSEEANERLRGLLERNEAFCAARFGFFELSVMRNFHFGREKNYKKILAQLKNCAGVFPAEHRVGEEFLRLMEASLGKLDCLSCSGEPFENYFARFFGKKEMIWSAGLELMTPWIFSRPWSAGLAGKKVLVVNPFAETIKSQYRNRELLFQGTDILPEFELTLYPSLVTIGDYRNPELPDFFAALEKQFREISDMDFDVALLGCGAYGFPLAARIRSELGKTAIHMGGVLQLLFGILGARWDGSRFPGQGVVPELKPFVNEHWTYPSKEETPAEAGNVEYGPYWKKEHLG